MLTLGRSAPAMLAAGIALSGCGTDAASPSPTPRPTSSPAAPNDLLTTGCATADPTGVGELTGAWEGDEGGVYYIRQIGDCLWWFGTELEDIDLGPTGQIGFANVAVGRIDGPWITVEWADIPLGDILGGGGLTLVYDADDDQIIKTQQRGDWQAFGATTFTRINPQQSAASGPSPNP